MQQPTDPTKQQNAPQEAPEHPEPVPSQPAAPQSEPVSQQPSQAQPEAAYRQQPARPAQETPYAPAPQQNPYEQQAYRQQTAYQQQPYQQAPSPYPAAYPMSDFDRTLRMVAFILNMVSLAVSAILIIPLAWMIPMCITSWRIYKGTRPNTTAFGVCTLIFVSLFGGILLLISKKDR